MPDLIASEELIARAVSINQLPLKTSGEFVLVWLRRSLRAYYNPAIDLGITLANSTKMPLIVYSQVCDDEPYMSDRLAYFALGANKVLAKGLKKRNIQHCFATNLAVKSRNGSLQRLSTFRHSVMQRASVIIVDQHFTAHEQQQITDIDSNASQRILEVDATRLVPHSQFSKSLHVTKTFRAAHSPLRKKWYALRKEVTLANTHAGVSFGQEDISIATLSNKQMRDLIARSNIDHRLQISSNHSPNDKELTSRLANLPRIVKQYRAKRNNPAITDSTSQLSPYLHFGMTSVFEILQILEQSDLAKADMWKFLDELITWREWSHWRLAKRPEFAEYESLPNSVQKTLAAHKEDDRELVLTEQALYDGQTPDEIWNAAQLYWRHTGWLHNNLRMYWATQFLRWTSSPQEAWQLACKFNDRQSLDGQDPACYISMRWAFGESKPSYSEKPVYGWVAKKSDRALRKREGFLDWVDIVLAKYQTK